jgi:hypothetical protein
MMIYCFSCLKNYNQETKETFSLTKRQIPIYRSEIGVRKCHRGTHFLKRGTQLYSMLRTLPLKNNRFDTIKYQAFFLLLLINV